MLTVPSTQLWASSSSGSVRGPSGSSVSNREHFYTTSVTERDDVVRDAGYKFEGIACYVW